MSYNHIDLSTYNWCAYLTYHILVKQRDGLYKNAVIIMLEAVKVNGLIFT